MIEKVLFVAAALLPGLAYCGDSSADQARATPTRADLARTVLGHHLLHGNSLRHFSAGG
jgi:hypothetical protein